MARRDSAFAVIRRQDRVLLVQARATRRWQLPGGAMQPAESPWRAALREVREETGLSARILGLTGLYRRRNGSMVFVFVARVPRGQDPRGPRCEIRRQRWVRFSKARRLLSKRAARRLCDAVRRPALFRTGRIDLGMIAG